MPIEDRHAQDLVSIIDADDQALAWVKDLSKVPLSQVNTISRGQLTTALVGKNEVLVVYGDKHPMYNAGSDNIAVFDTWMELNSFGTNFDATGSRPISTPIESWKALGLRWSIGGSLMEHSNKNLACIERDQLFATTLLQKLVEAHDGGNLKLNRGFLLHQKGSRGGEANQFICHLDPIYGEPKPRADLPRSNGPSPRKRPEKDAAELAPSSSRAEPADPETPQPSTRKRGGNYTPAKSDLKKTCRSPSPATPVQVILSTIPKSAGAPGIYYPAEIIEGFNPRDFQYPTRLRAVQLPIFDDEGNLVLPSQVPQLLTPGTPVRMRLSFGAWKAADSDVMRPFIRAKEIYVIGEHSNSLSRKDAISEKDVVSDSDVSPSLLDNSPLAKKGKQAMDSIMCAHFADAGSPDPFITLSSKDVPKIKAEPDDDVPVKKNKGKAVDKVIIELADTEEEAEAEAPLKVSTSRADRRETRKRKASVSEASPIKKRKTRA